MTISEMQQNTTAMTSVIVVGKSMRKASNAFYPISPHKLHYKYIAGKLIFHLMAPYGQRYSAPKMHCCQSCPSQGTGNTPDSLL